MYNNTHNNTGNVREQREAHQNREIRHVGLVRVLLHVGMFRFYSYSSSSHNSSKTSKFIIMPVSLWPNM